MSIPKLILAPMAGITDLAFRTVCAKCGADFAVSEMVSAKAMFFGDKKSRRLADISNDILPMSIQIFGSDCSTLSFAASELENNSPVSIDINMGCPMPKIVNNGDGSAILKDPKKAGELVKAVVAATSLPVTVKIRSGWDENSINAVEVAKYCEDNGASAITVHGRTKKQLYSGKADWSVIKSVNECVNVPVIGNGDIVDGDSAKRLMIETGCDTIMIGRAALGDPWIFSRIKSYFNNKNFIEPSWDEKKKTILEHLDILRSEKGDRISALEARKHISWYLKGIDNACSIRNEVNRAETIEKMIQIIDF